MEIVKVLIRVQVHHWHAASDHVKAFVTISIEEIITRRQLYRRGENVRLQSEGLARHLYENPISLPYWIPSEFFEAPSAAGSKEVEKEAETAPADSPKSP